MFILIVTGAPSVPYNGTVVTWYDKVFHMILFGGLVFFVILALELIPRLPFLLSALIALAISASYSAGVEYLQGFIPGRTVSIYDFYAGVAGAFVMIIIMYARYKLLRKA